MSAPSWSDLAQSAAVIGHYRYAELSFSQLSGRKAAEGGVRAPFLAGAAGAHAWRAVLFEELLPVSVGLPGVSELTRSPGASFESLLAELDALSGEDLAAALVGAVYPVLLATWSAHASCASPLADAPLRRALGRAAGDLAAVRDEGMGLIGRDGLPAVAPALRSLIVESCTFGRQLPASAAGAGA